MTRAQPYPDDQYPDAGHVRLLVTAGPDGYGRHSFDALWRSDGRPRGQVFTSNLAEAVDRWTRNGYRVTVSHENL